MRAYCGDILLCLMLVVSTLFVRDAILDEDFQRACKPEIRIVYCYKQGDGFPDNCGE